MPEKVTLYLLHPSLFEVPLCLNRHPCSLIWYAMVIVPRLLVLEYLPRYHRGVDFRVERGVFRPFFYFFANYR